MTENSEITTWETKREMIEDLSEESGVDVEDIKTRTFATIES